MNELMLYDDELYHHGILGQKWGVRRFQNTDGSLTPSGIKRAASIRRKYTKLTEGGGQEISNSAKAARLKAKYSEITGGKTLKRIPKNPNDKEKVENKAKSTKKLSTEDLNKLADQIKARKDAEKRYKEALEYGGPNTYKSAEQMNFKELSDAIARKKAENEYNALINPPKQKKEHPYLKKIASTIGDVALDTGKAYLTKTLKETLGLNPSDTIADLEKQARAEKYKRDMANNKLDEAIFTEKYTRFKDALKNKDEDAISEYIKMQKTKDRKAYKKSRKRNKED